MTSIPKVRHASDCAVHNEPALPAGPCDCGAERHVIASPAEKLFDEIDSLQVRLRGLREQRNDLLEQTLRLDFEIGQTRLKLTTKGDEFQRLTDAEIQKSVVRSAPDADAAPAPSSMGAGCGYLFQGLIEGLTAPWKLS